MAQALTRELNAQLNALEKLGVGLRMTVLAAINLRLGVDIKAPDGNETLKLLPGSLVASEAPTSSVISSLVGAFEALLDTRSAASGSLPVICIDEVHVLMDWFEGDRALQTDLEALLRFFVKVGYLLVATVLLLLCAYAFGYLCSMQITKETQQAHVILATSEYSFLTWLTESEPRRCLVGGHALAAAHLPVSGRAAGRLLHHRGHWGFP